MCYFILTRFVTKINLYYKHMLTRRNLFTSYGFKLKYVEPGLSSLSICCGPVRTESFFSIAFTLMYKTYTYFSSALKYLDTGQESALDI